MTQPSAHISAAHLLSASNPSERQVATWSELPLQERLSRVCALRHQLAGDPQPWIDAIRLPFRTDAAETLAAEIIPLADACKFLQTWASKILRPTRLGRWGRPVWLFGTHSEIHRVPLGTVLIIGPVNYPLMIPGIGVIQALVAGNRVMVKPAPGTRAVMELLVKTLHDLGVPTEACICLGEEPEQVHRALDEADKVILTGSATTGKIVAAAAAERLLPSVMELSGCDSAIVLSDANPELTVRCLEFGRCFNSGNSCIAPRRIFVSAEIAPRITPKLAAFDQLTVFNDLAQVISATNHHEFRLGTSIFGSIHSAKALAAKLDVGCVVINDVIVPTADPRLPFGGRGRSGFGATRGTEGLLEMTAIKTISVRRHGPRLHLQPHSALTADILRQQLAVAHGKSLTSRLAAFSRLLTAGRLHQRDIKTSATKTTANTTTTTNKDLTP